MKTKILTFILIVNFISVFPVNEKVSAQSLSVISEDILSGSALETVGDNIESGSSADTGTDNIITVLEVSGEEVPLQFFPVNSEITGLELYNYAAVITKEYLYIHCKIKWDSPETIDTSTPGRKTLKGYLIPPDGCIFENNAKPYVEIPIIIYDESGEGTETLLPPTEIDYNDDIIIVTPGTDISSYLETEYEYPVYTETGDYFYCNVKWENISSFTETGYHNIQGRLRLPKGIKARNEDDTIVYKRFYVMKDDKIYIGPHYKHGSSAIIFPWLKEIDDPENIEFYYSYDGENWSIVQDDYYGFADYNYLFISTLKLEADKDYYFRLCYKGEYTDIIKINLSKDEITSIGGDRDGGDNSEQEMPPVKQSYRSGGHGVTSDKDENPVITEKSDENSTTVSGKRLKDMIKTPDNKITFEKDGIEVKIPGDFIEENNIEENDAVTVTIDKKDDNKFSFSLDINDKKIKDIPHSEVYIPRKNSKEPEKFIINSTGEYDLPPDNIIENEPSDNPKISDKNLTSADDIITAEQKNTVTPIPVISIIIFCSLFIAILIILWRTVFYEKQQR